MTEKGLKDAVSVYVYMHVYIVYVYIVYVYIVYVYVCMSVCELVANPTYTIYTAYRE